MPELPEVETVARTLYPHIRDCVISDMRVLRPASLHELSLKPESAIGLRIASTRRRGKLLVIGLEGGAPGAPDSLVIHLRMTGRLFTREANEALGKHTRCVFNLALPNGSERLLFFDDTRAFGKILLATPTILQRWSFWRELGPEPLEIGVDTFAPRLRGARAIKSALLDQKVVAGIGNIYADEALFMAGLAPTREAGSLSDQEAERLLAAIQHILKLSISQCGSSIRDYRDADGNAGAFQNTFQAYGRGGLPCKRCGALLSKTRITGRATVFCPNCQK